MREVHVYNRNISVALKKRKPEKSSICRLHKFFQTYYLPVKSRLRSFYIRGVTGAGGGGGGGGGYWEFGIPTPGRRRPNKGWSKQGAKKDGR